MPTDRAAIAQYVGSTAWPNFVASVLGTLAATGPSGVGAAGGAAAVAGLTSSLSSFVGGAGLVLTLPLLGPYLFGSVARARRRARHNQTFVNLALHGAGILGLPAQVALDRAARIVGGLPPRLVNPRTRGGDTLAGLLAETSRTAAGERVRSQQAAALNWVIGSRPAGALYRSTT